MSNQGDEFGARVVDCAVDIGERVSGIADRFGVMVLVGAFVQHVGEALQLLLRRKLCDAQQARRFLRRIEATAFEENAK